MYDRARHHATGRSGDETVAETHPLCVRGNTEWRPCCHFVPDKKALAAIHRFLQFQIEEHQTGDPTAVR
jgi:hypothetical protein